MASFGSLPVELIRKIVLATFNRPRNHDEVYWALHCHILLPLCLVNKTFNAIATEYLYRDLGLPDQSTAELFLETVSSHRWTMGAMAG